MFDSFSTYIQLFYVEYESVQTLKGQGKGYKSPACFQVLAHHKNTAAARANMFDFGFDL